MKGRRKTEGSGRKASGADGKPRTEYTLKVRMSAGERDELFASAGRNGAAAFARAAIKRALNAEKGESK